MRRREFITLLGGAAAAWPFAAHTQEAQRIRRVGIISSVGESDPEALAWHGAFRRSLQQLGWIEGRNVRFDSRFGTAGNPELVRKSAAELLALSPDVIVAGGSPNVRALQQATRSVPIVFAQRRRPGRRGTGPKPRAAGWQYHRLHRVRIRAQREMAGAAQRDRAKRDARGRHS